MNIFRFNKKYFLFAVILFIIEVLIGMYVTDQFIRPYGGDYLVVILIYYFVRAFIKSSAGTVAIGVLIFSFAVEIAQYFKIVEVIGLKGNRLAEIVIGTGFSWWDMLAYTLGVLTVYLIDRRE